MQQTPTCNGNPTELLGERRHVPAPGPSSIADLSSPSDPLFTGHPSPSDDPDPSSNPETDTRIAHKTNISLALHVDGEDKDNHYIHLRTSVEVSWLVYIVNSISLNPSQFYPIPNQKEHSDSNRNTVEVNIVRLEVLRSASVEIDQAVGSLELHAEDEGYFDFHDL